MIDGKAMEQYAESGLGCTVEKRPLGTELAVVVGDDEACVRRLLVLRARHQTAQGRHVVDVNVLPGEAGGPALTGWMVTRPA